VHTQNKIARLLYCISKKAHQKAGQKKSAKISRPKKIGQKKVVGQKNLQQKSQPKKVGQKKQQKRRQKRKQKRRQERWEKSLFLNLSCCCLETGLKQVLFYFMFCLRPHEKHYLLSYFCCETDRSVHADEKWL